MGDEVNCRRAADRDDCRGHHMLRSMAWSSELCLGQSGRLEHVPHLLGDHTVLSLFGGPES
jgi:hypothetical protein